MNARCWLLIARGLSHAEIAESLVVSPAPVKTHVGPVFAKVGARDRAQAVVRAYEHGLVEAPLRQRCAVCPQHFPRPFAQWASSPAAHRRRAGVGVIIRH